MAFEWKERYNLGIKEIDIQHKKLLEIGGKVYSLAKSNDNHDHYDEIMELLNELLDYTKYHFTYEEELLKSHGYVELEDQEQEHSFYIEKIKSLSSEDIDSDQQKTILELLNFLSQWVSNHIMLSDRKYAAFLNEKGVF